MPKCEANSATSTSALHLVRGYHHLTDEEKNRLEIIAYDDSQVVFYKPKRKQKKKRAAIGNSDLIPSIPRVTGREFVKKKTPVATDAIVKKKTPVAAAAIVKKKTHNSNGNVETIPNIKGAREQTSVNVRRQERNIRNDRAQRAIANAPNQGDRDQPSVNLPHQGDREQPSANVPHQGRNKDRSNKSAKSITASRIGYRTRSAINYSTRYKAIKLAQVLLAVYIGVLTYADIGPPGGLRDTETGLIIDQASPERTARGLILVNGTERAIVGATYFQVVCVGITRMR